MRSTAAATRRGASTPASPRRWWPTPIRARSTTTRSEVGLKKDFGRSLQVNLAAYYYNYKDFQAPVTIIPTSGGIGTAQTVFFNVPKAISKGFEAEVNWAPIDNLRLNASYSYTDAYIDEASGLVDPTDPTAINPAAKPVGSPRPSAPRRRPPARSTSTPASSNAVRT